MDNVIRSVICVLAVGVAIVVLTVCALLVSNGIQKNIKNMQATQPSVIEARESDLLLSSNT